MGNYSGMWVNRFCSKLQVTCGHQVRDLSPYIQYMAHCCLRYYRLSCFQYCRVCYFKGAAICGFKSSLTRFQFAHVNTLSVHVTSRTLMLVMESMFVLGPMPFTLYVLTLVNITKYAINFHSNGENTQLKILELYFILVSWHIFY